jgi:hypothetical protein
MKVNDEQLTLPPNAKVIAAGGGHTVGLKKTLLVNNMSRRRVTSGTSADSKRTNATGRSEEA